MDQNLLIEAAEKYAKHYECTNDARCIISDVLNAFYKGASWGALAERGYVNEALNRAIEIGRDKGPDMALLFLLTVLRKCPKPMPEDMEWALQQLESVKTK